MGARGKREKWGKGVREGGMRRERIIVSMQSNQRYNHPLTASTPSSSTFSMGPSSHRIQLYPALSW